MHLTVDGELISTTVNHPFWVKGKGFVGAGELKAGDELVKAAPGNGVLADMVSADGTLVDAAGGSCVIEKVRLEIMERPERVYNFQVEDFHTYHVGSNGVLVHNAECGGEGGTVAEGDAVTEGGTETLARYGDDFGKMGTYVENPEIKVDWAQYAEHGAERMQQRGMTQEMVHNIIEDGKVLSQNNGSKFAYITKDGVAIVSKGGKLITAWSSADFDSSMLEIIKKLFGE